MNNLLSLFPALPHPPRFHFSPLPPGYTRSIIRVLCICYCLVLVVKHGFLCPLTRALCRLWAQTAWPGLFVERYEPHCLWILHIYPVQKSQLVYMCRWHLLGFKVWLVRQIVITKYKFHLANFSTSHPSPK